MPLLFGTPVVDIDENGIGISEYYYAPEYFIHLLVTNQDSDNSDSNCHLSTSFTIRVALVQVSQKVFNHFSSIKF